MSNKAQSLDLKVSDEPQRVDPYLKAFSIITYLVSKCLVSFLWGPNHLKKNLGGNKHFMHLISEVQVQQQWDKEPCHAICIGPTRSVVL